MSTTEHAYHVTWEGDVLASSPEEAAEAALSYFQNPASYPPIFTVTGPDGQSTDVDMADDDDEEES